MGLLSALEISGSALDAQRLRIETLSTNLANASVTRTPQGGPYQRKEVVFEAAPAATFAATIEDALANADEQQLPRVSARVVDDTAPFVSRYEPGHPDADAMGYVLYPNVNPVEEMVNIVESARSFEASTAAMNAVKEMVQRSIELGR